MLLAEQPRTQLLTLAVAWRYYPHGATVVLLCKLIGCILAYYGQTITGLSPVCSPVDLTTQRSTLVTPARPPSPSTQAQARRVVPTPPTLTASGGRRTARSESARPQPEVTRVEQPVADPFSMFNDAYTFATDWVNEAEAMLPTSAQVTPSTQTPAIATPQPPARAALARPPSRPAPSISIAPARISLPASRPDLLSGFAYLPVSLPELTPPMHPRSAAADRRQDEFDMILLDDVDITGGSDPLQRLHSPGLPDEFMVDEETAPPEPRQPANRPRVSAGSEHSLRLRRTDSIGSLMPPRIVRAPAEQAGTSAVPSPTAPVNPVTSARIRVRRSHVVQDSFHRLKEVNSANSLLSSLSVSFEGEDASGPGVTREWLHLLISELFAPEASLFEPCEDIAGGVYFTFLNWKCCGDFF